MLIGAESAVRRMPDSPEFSYAKLKFNFIRISKILSSIKQSVTMKIYGI
ncbi:hypothetical protein LEP1GSC186_1689 [Leptospira noguchii serovar Autumnalis str. ZUN142]|uniref:Uncharacterized protein n=1 Tax=Leptospira noguchii serovar Autumnalis str. ZUN142 TaxID=1085540 RepID=M6URR7_9LEPT|nr:hypothetical protein LEP1GSC186_1689 [Leptospira noguchii serovar Autumnalis str. ZUN142]